MRVAVRAILCLAVMHVASPPLAAQTLGDVARQEAERRKALGTEKTDGKVYTNKDLRPVPPPPPKPADVGPAAPAAPAASAASSGTAATAADAAPKDAQAGKPTAPPDDMPKGEDYWRGRLKELQTTLSRNETYVAALQSRINALNTDFVNRDDPAQREVIDADRRGALAELERLKKEIETTKKAITDLQDEARRARVPPGWLR